MGWFWSWHAATLRQSVSVVHLGQWVTKQSHHFSVGDILRRVTEEPLLVP